MKVKRLVSLVVTVIIILEVLLYSCVTMLADGDTLPADSLPQNITAPYSYVLMEGSTGTLLYADNGNAVVRPFHSAKLMVLLLLCESVEAGLVSEDTVVTVSNNANSMQGSQIWLDVGEKILMSELISAITVGNANDACVAIAEALADSEEDFVSLMNKRAKELGMSSTFYADSTGTADGSTTTACDTAILASNLSRYSWLSKYMTTWMTSVRGGKAELVSQNRLIRSYKDITGMKAYYHRDCGNCLIATAERDGLTMVCVIFGEQDEFEHFSTAKEKMNIGFMAYSIYTPKAREIICEPVAVRNGVIEAVDTVVGDMQGFVIRKSMLDKLSIEIEYFDDVTAPVEAGQIVGRAVYKADDEELYAVDLVAKVSVKKMSFFSAFAHILKSMFAY